MGKVQHDPRCNYWQEPPTLRDPKDCNCGAYGPPLNTRVPVPTNHLIVQDAGKEDILSDILQAQASVLLDLRAEGLRPQIQIRGLTRAGAAVWLMQAAKELGAT